MAPRPVGCQRHGLPDLLRLLATRRWVVTYPRDLCPAGRSQVLEPRRTEDATVTEDGTGVSVAAHPRRRGSRSGPPAGLLVLLDHRAGYLDAAYVPFETPPRPSRTAQAPGSMR